MKAILTSNDGAREVVEFDPSLNHTNCVRTSQSELLCATDSLRLSDLSRSNIAVSTAVFMSV